ncbi:MAG: type II toxin-antitoxin system prevent-host-death family antitoxin [bacterium]|nr:type II toxin-antitoxin system prevent-host-death family antitoxin [bacterium]
MIQHDGITGKVQQGQMGSSRMIPGNQFRAHFSAMVDWVRDTGKPIVLTRYGEPVVQVAPLNPVDVPETLLGFGKGIKSVPPDFDIKAEDLFEQWESKLLKAWDSSSDR